MFDFPQMIQEEAEEIASNWKYSGEYSFYNATADEEDYAEFIDPIKRGDVVKVEKSRHFRRSIHGYQNSKGKSEISKCLYGGTLTFKIR